MPESQHTASCVSGGSAVVYAHPRSLYRCAAPPPLAPAETGRDLNWRVSLWDTLILQTCAAGTPNDYGEPVTSMRFRETPLSPGLPRRTCVFHVDSHVCIESTFNSNILA